MKLKFHYSLLEDFPTSEEVWNLVARRPLVERQAEVKKGSAVITGLHHCYYALIHSCFTLYNVEPPLRGHPQDKEKCPLNGGVNNQATISCSTIIFKDLIV